MVGLLAAFPFAIMSQEAGTATLSGRVVDDSGRAIASVSVNYRRLDDLKRDKNHRYIVVSTPVNRVVSTSADGRFSVGGLPPGDYHVCALPSAPIQVGTCEWHRNRGPFAVASGRTTTVPDLVLTNGRTLLIRVLDPNSRLTARAKLLVGVMSDGGYYRRAEPAPVAPAPGVATVLSVVIPPGPNVGLFIDSDLDVRDSSARIVPIRQRGPNVTLGAPGTETTVDLRLN
jgi:hypothetical protein